MTYCETTGDAHGDIGKGGEVFWEGALVGFTKIYATHIPQTVALTSMHYFVIVCLFVFMGQSKNVQGVEKSLQST